MKPTWPALVASLCCGCSLILDPTAAVLDPPGAPNADGDADGDGDGDRDADGDGGGDADGDGDADSDGDGDADGDADADGDGDADGDADADGDGDGDVNPLIGQVYVQGGGVGWASYHFERIDYAYINYEDAPWTLDNGAPLPDRKPWIDPVFDVPGRRFTGTIDWSDPEGTTFDGDEVWEYEMIFSADWRTIEGGQIECYGPSGAFRYSQEYGPGWGDLQYRRLE